jgi:translation initiation factor IF-3
MMKRGGRPIPNKDTTRINERIRIPNVRVVDEEGNQVGVLSSQEALALARQRGLDLVEVSPNAVPPVCRIMDYGKYKYEMKKKAAKAKRVQHRIQVKEVKFRPKIDDHDFNFKVQHAREFLEHNNKVKFIVQFRGREVAHSQLGAKLLELAATALVDIGQVESPARQEGHTITMYMMPRKDRPKAPVKPKPKEPKEAKEPKSKEPERQEAGSS